MNRTIDRLGTMLHIVPMIQQNRRNRRMPFEQTDQFRPAVAPKTDNARSQLRHD